MAISLQYNRSAFKLLNHFKYQVLLLISLLLIIVSSIPVGYAQGPAPEVYLQRSQDWSEGMNARGLADPFVGLTTDGEPIADLFELRSTGVSTQSVWQAANDFLAVLSDQQRSASTFSVDDIEWRKWANQHIYYREGIPFDEMNSVQQEAAFSLLTQSLSAKGLTLTRDIMRLNETLGELNNNNFVEYGEGKYWLTVMGEPSATEPWGWQLDGHHLVINYFVLGDQVVMTPSFWGSEPALATSGKYAGTEIMIEEQELGLRMIQSLNPQQQTQAIVQTSKGGNNILAQAFSDNVVLDYAGINAAALSSVQRQQLLSLIELYIGNVREDQQSVQMAEVVAHLDDTYFAWVGGYGEDDVFYYRIHSPVLMIEFDHETPVGLTHMYPRGVPYKEHIHAVVRTPNGNDYGRDLLRQHYLQHPH